MPSEDAPKSSPEVAPTHRPSLATQAKSFAAFITAVAALTVAITKACQAPVEPGAKASYAELSSAIHENSEAIAKAHDDVVALRGYVDGIVKADGLAVVPSASAVTLHPVDAGATPAAPPASTLALLVPLDRSKLKPPPTASPRPTVFQPLSYDDLMKK